MLSIRYGTMSCRSAISANVETPVLRSALTGLLCLCLNTWAPGVTHCHGRHMLVALAQRLDLLGGGFGPPLHLANPLDRGLGRPLYLADLLGMGLGRLLHLVELLGGGLGRPLHLVDLFNGGLGRQLRLADLFGGGLGWMGHSWGVPWAFFRHPVPRTT